MIQKWKCILTNWINCYFSDKSDNTQTVNLDSLLNIISHLRENLNLDESKSSVLGAHKVEEFILEKYTEFKFENGTVEATNDEDVYLAASLLLFFVCVNSKDVVLKNAMCSRLSAEDQETILKFSKSLLECSPILRGDVQAAIIDACGQDINVMNSATSLVTVAETPPALRSLHGEVRRLQAALDAERFDRNYLQDELARTNLRVEKLLKDKEQYKLDIVNLKTKISLCCGQDDEEQSTEAKSDRSAKLSRQLHEMEERLVQTQGELDEVMYERDAYKTKMEELKQDRDKWLQVSQQESLQVSQLAAELETERRNVQSLRELVSELRQHNRLNRFDSSLLECDDPDASLQSLHHNSSVCSEACANVVEVQLGEERAKIAVLQQQIQTYQDQINDLNDKSENEKRTLETIITERENDIFNLKHRINEEIEKNNNLKAHFNDEVSKLNNETNELEQRLKGTNENSRAIIDRKMQEIQILQEEKLSLLQSLSNETTKLENIIKDLNSAIEAEKQTKLNMKDSYENHIMKLNEKVLNRNNELVELQNNISEKSDVIESLHFELRRTKEINGEVQNKYHNDMLQLNEEKNAIESVLQQKSEEATELKAVLDQKISVIGDLNNKMNNFKLSLSNLKEDCKILEETKSKLLAEIHNRDTKSDKMFKDMENLKKIFSEENEKLSVDLNEGNAMINTLQMQLQNEIQYKIQLQNELTRLQKAKSELSEHLTTLNAELLELKTIIKEKDKTIDAVDMCLHDQSILNEKLSLDVDNLKEELQKAKTELSEHLTMVNVELLELKTIIKEKDKTIDAIDMCLHDQKILNEKLSLDVDNLKEELQKVGVEKEDIRSQSNVLEDANKKLQEKLKDIAEHIKLINKELHTEIAEKEALQATLTSLTNEKNRLEKDVSDKLKVILQLQSESEKLSQIAEENKLVIQSLEEKFKEENQSYVQLQKSFDSETSKIVLKLNETEKKIKELSSNSKKTINSKELQIQTLTKDLKSIKNTVDNYSEEVHCIQKEKEALTLKLDEERSYKDEIVKEYQSQCILLNNVTTQLNEEIFAKNSEINALKLELQSVSNVMDDKCAEIKKIEETLSQESQQAKELMYQKTTEIKELQRKINYMESFNDELKQELNKETDNIKQVIQSLQKEKEELHFTIEDNNSNHEVLLKEKDRVIDTLERQLKDRVVQLESLRKDYEDITLTLEKFKFECRENLQSKEAKINQSNQLVANLEQSLIDAEKVNNQMKNQLEELIKGKEESELAFRTEIMTLTQALSLEEEKRSLAAHENVLLETHLINKQADIDALETEKKELLKAKSILIRENEELINAKVILTQELSEERSLRKIVDEEKNVLKSDMMTIEQELLSEISIKNISLEEKECLTQQLVEEKSARHLSEKEKENLTVVKELLERKLVLNEKNIEKLTKEINDCIKQQIVLKEEYVKEKLEKDLLERENSRLSQELMKEKISNDQLLKEKEHLAVENESLKNEAMENKLIQDTLVTDKDVLLLEKETLVKSLSEEKSARDEFETEKNKLSKINNDLDQKYNLELNTKVGELKSMESEIKHLKSNYDTLKQNTTQISSILNIGLEQLVENLKKEDICNEVLQKLITVDQTEDMTVNQKCDMIINIADTLTTEVSMRKSLEKALEHENSALSDIREMCKQKEMKVLELQSEVKRLEQVVNEKKMELTIQMETYNTSLNSKARDLQTLQQENQTLHNDLNDVKVQLEIKVSSFNEKLTDNELLTDKLKRSYECQIDNLNLMIAKLTNYLRDKTVELDTMRKEKEIMHQTVQENKKVITSLEDEVKSEKQNQDKLISDFESERLVLKNMVTVTESVMEDQKISLNYIISEHLTANDTLQDENKTLKLLIDKEKSNLEHMLLEKDVIFETVFKEFTEVKAEKDKIMKDMEILRENMTTQINSLDNELCKKTSEIETLEAQNKNISNVLQRYKDDIDLFEKQSKDLKIKNNALELEVDKVRNALQEQTDTNKNLECTLKETIQHSTEIQEKVKVFTDEIDGLLKDKNALELEKNECIIKLEEIKIQLDSNLLSGNEELKKLRIENMHLVSIIEDNKTVITNLELLIKHELEQNHKLRKDTTNEILSLVNKCSILQDYQTNAEKDLDERQREIDSLKKEVETLKCKIDICEQDLRDKDEFISKISKEKDAIIGTISKELLEEKEKNEYMQTDLESKTAAIYELKQHLEKASDDTELKALRKENDELIQAIGQRETFAVQNQENTSQKSVQVETEHLLHQVDNSSSDITQSSMESLKTITDLEKIIHDKNRTITTLQSDITYLKTLIAESETKLLDVTKELDISKENCQQLSSQLKKIVYQKNEEIAELKKQVTKMSVTETRATQIIRVSAKYQAIILKRIAEIKSNTVLKELTNFGNSNTCDNELRRSLTAGIITMEDLENFLETTDRHLKRCSEKQIALQKERDRLTEVNRINESEIINLTKFLTELSVSFQTFSSVKDLYAQKLSRIVSVQRTVRREILSLDGNITDACMCKLERGYAAVMQDLSECAMNLERWVERCVLRNMSPEKIKQAFTSDSEHVSLASTSFQNAGLEVQLDELENSFQKLLEEVARESKGEGAKDAQAITVMEVRAEYEDKLNRMKAKMKQLYQEQITIFKERQREEMALLEQELQKATHKLAESSKAYEEHIRSLTTELWSVGEKFLMKKDEAEWLRRKQRSGSLMSLQHVHSTGLVPPQEETSRPSDSHSLRSLPVNNNNTKREGRGLHMSDEEGEVFDNRCLKELSATPRRESQPPDFRLSQLRWRNSLCPPHLKSSYPAETQFAPALDEEDIKCVGTISMGAKQQRKEVGITAYKKPGPPTPSKQAGRLSATDSELRESLRVEAEPQPGRKTSTPSRLRALFRHARNDTAEGTPRSRKLSNIFKKK